MIRIAIDAMGGDYAPEEIVQGALAVAGPELNIQLVGDVAQIEKVMVQFQKGATGYIDLIEAKDIINFDEEPVKAVKSKPDSSLVRSFMQVANGDADGVVSAGSTGAVLAASLMILKRIKGVKRPGLLSILPAPKGPTLFMDVGANNEAKPSHLLGFAEMATIFARDVMGLVNPTVGLLSNGEESVKGNDLVVEAHNLMARSSHINFYGNVEGRDVLRKTVDIVITDGFTGNVCLKLMEDTAGLMIEEVKKVAMSSFSSRLGGLLLKRKLRSFKKTIDPEEYGGAYLLGVRGLVVVCHGNSSKKAIANAITYAARAAKEQFTARLEETVKNGGH